MSRRRLSDQLRDQLGSLGESLAKHTRSLEGHLERQGQALLERHDEIERDQRQLLAGESSSDAKFQELLAPFLKGDFRLMSVAELRKFCTSKGLRKVSRLNKPELLRVLDYAGLEPPQLPPEKVIKKLKKAQLEAIALYFLSDAL